MIPTPIAFSPSSVTGIFLPVFDPEPARTVSRGLAFCLNAGVTVGLAPASTPRILLNGVPLQIPPVMDLLLALAPEPVAAHFDTNLPLGCGFGVSAACALSLVIGLNRRFELGKSREELGQMAHAAEVRHRTGVGDVAVQLTGGIVYRRCLEGPFDVVRLDHIPAQELYYRVFGPLPTAEVLNAPDKLAAIQAAGAESLEWLARHYATVNLPEILDRSLAFSERTGLLTSPRVREAIREVRQAGGAATMVMLGHCVLATRPGPSGEWVPCQIDPQGVRLLL